MKAFAASVMALALVGCVTAMASGAGEQCAAAGGVCRDPNSGCGNGDWKVGLCPGTSRCCIAWTTTAQCKAKNGMCAAKAGCAGSQVTGLCPGSSVCCVAKTNASPATPATPTPAPVTPTPTPAPTTPTPTPATPTPAVPPVGTVVRMPSGAGQIGFCTADGKRAGLCKSTAACGKLAGHTAKAGVCTHSQVCCTPPAGVALDGQLGLDIEGSVISAATAQCYRQTGFSFFMVRVWRTSNSVDTSAPDNIRRLAAAGFTDIDVYTFHDFRKDPVAAANTFMKYLKDQGVLGMVKRVWLDIERDINGAYMWSRTDKASNLRKVLQMIEAVKAFGKLPGIYAPGAGGWDEIMGSGKVADVVPMWYVSRRGYNNDASDEDWIPFANWGTNPPVNTQHQFYSGDGSSFKVCGVSGLDWTYRRAPIALPYNWDPVAKRAI